jgi:UDP-glucose 4-epimerase
MSSRVLITGGSGFMGLHLARRLLAEGYAIDLVDDFSRGVRDPEFSQFIEAPNVTVIEGDLLDPATFGTLADDYELVFHFAAILGVANVLERPYEVLSNNVRMLLGMLDFARTLGGLRRFLFPSTSEVYAGTLESFTLPIPTPESTPLAVSDLSHPRTSYMLSKVCGEALCRHAGVPFTIIRPHNVYGPRMGMSHVIPELLKRAHDAPEGGGLEVASVNHTRTFCYIDDAIELIKRATESPECEGLVLNVGNQTPELSVRALAEIVVETVGKPLDIIEKPETPGSVTRRCPDMTETTLRTGYSAGCDLDTGVRLTYEWYREQVFGQGHVSAV